MRGDSTPQPLSQPNVTLQGGFYRKIARRYSDHWHSGLKTRVRATLDLTKLEIQAVESGEAPLYKTRLEEELGDHVGSELIPVCALVPSA